MKRCSQCDRPGSDDVLIEYGDALVCVDCKEGFLDKLKQGLPLQRPLPGSGLGPWRVGRDMVVFDKGESLPPSCIKCGRPTSESVPQTLTIPLIPRLLNPRNGSVQVRLPYCAAHYWKLKRRRIAWKIASLVGVATIVMLAFFISDFAGALLVLLFLAVPAYLFLTAGSPTLRLSAQAIEDHFVFATGASWPYLSRLPEWPELKGKKHLELK